MLESATIMAKDFYDILGLKRGATDAEIKQAYRKLSRELHPDKHKGDKQKEAKFKEVNEAYDVLSDAKKKQAYDQFGSTDGNPFGGGFGGGNSSGFGGFDFNNIDPNAFGGMGDIFESFFGGARQRKSDGRGRTVEVEVTIPFADSVAGVERTIEFTSNVTCSECDGKGSAEGSKMVNCKECGGTGAVTQNVRSLFGTIRQSVVCPTCRGSGKVPEKPCKKCHGEGRVQERKKVTVRIPAGISDGQALRVEGDGEAGRQGAKNGDLLVRIRVAPDPSFVRDGDDIYSALAIPLVTAVLGGTVELKTVHGKSEITIPAGTQPKQVLRLKGKGMPIISTSRHGDHYVTIDITIPAKLSKEQKKLFEELRATEE
jgi:molecular chaperone DnaJ